MTQHTHNPILCATCAKCDFASYYFLCVRDVSLVRAYICHSAYWEGRARRRRCRESCRANGIADDDDGNNGAWQPAGTELDARARRQNDRTAPERIAINKRILRKSAWRFLRRGARMCVVCCCCCCHTHTHSHKYRHKNVFIYRRQRARFAYVRLVHNAPELYEQGVGS